MRSALLLVLVVVACKPKQDARASDGCLDLPHAYRTALRADPRGGGLYWLERAMARDFDGNDRSFDRLVRYDLATKRATTLFEPVSTPIQFTKDGVLVVSKRGENAALVHIQADGFVQALLPSYFDVKDVEPIDGTRYAVAAGVDNKWRIFTLDLDAPRPVHLYDADVLLSAVRGTVFVRDGKRTFAVDAETGEAAPRDVSAAGMPDRELVYFVEDQQVKVKSLATNETRTLVEDRRRWMLLHQSDSVLARAGTVNYQHAVLLQAGKATPLPRLRGGTSIVGLARLADATYALVGHNTSHVDGDLWAWAHEADVCMLDTSERVLAIETRSLPARYTAKSKAFWDAVSAIPNTRWQLLDNIDTQPMLYVNIDENGSSDVAQLRERAREIHKTIARTFDDDELSTYVEWQNGYTASYRWRREHLRGRTTAGIGDLHRSDPSDFDLDLAESLVEKVRGVVHCKGTLKNLRAVTLLDLEVRCIAWDRKRVLRIPKLEAGAVYTFDETFEATEDDYLVIDVFRGRVPQLVRDVTAEAQVEARYAFFVELQAATKLSLLEHDISDEHFYIRLKARSTDGIDDIEVDTIAAVAKQLEEARARLGVPRAPRLELQLFVERKIYDWDGLTLVPVD